MPRQRRGWAMGEDGRGRGRRRHTPLTVSLLEPALLILLQQQPSHGYPLLTDLEKWGMGSIHPSVVYRTLRDMEDLTWIESAWDNDATQGPPRRIYQVTNTGQEALEIWYAELIKVRGIISDLIEKVDIKKKGE